MNYIIASLVGAVIGYITNWLAIKMLFRPLTEKKIFGVRIPFTPGLIPKERYRISETVGSTISTYLLSKDTIIESLYKQNIDKIVKKWIIDKIKSIISDNESLGNRMSELLGSGFKDNLENSINEYLMKSMKDENNKNAAANFIGTQIENSDALKKGIESFIKIAISDAETKDNSLIDIIPESLVNSLKVLVYNKNYEISVYLKEMLQEDKIQEKIKNAINEMIGSNFSPMVAMFINPAMISEKVINTLSMNLDKEETRREIALLINDTIDKILKSRVSEISYSVSQEGIQSVISTISETISEKLLDKEFIKEKMDDIIDGTQLELMMKSAVHYLVDKVMKMTVNSIIGGKEENLVAFVSVYIDNMFNDMTKDKLASIIETLNISRIIEERLNEFDAEFIEKLILEISSKELSAITWLGALLGAIIGILSPLLNSLY